MLNLALMSAFIPTFIFVSLTPGMCMTLSMTMGLTIGVRRTLWMMLGELAGVGTVAVLAVIGVAALMLKAPLFFVAFKWVGGAYLFWLGVQMWLSRGRLAIPEEGSIKPREVSRWQLISQGYITAVANPKGWAFFMVLLPPFLDDNLPMVPQLTVLVIIILCIEWMSLMLYASGGHTLRRLLTQSKNVRLLNRIAGSLMIGVAFWLALG